MTDYRYKRAVLLGVDGAGIFFEKAATPHMDRIFKNGATSYNVMTSLPTISAECWGSMLLGSSAQAHGLTNSVVGAKHYDENSPIPSVFKRIRCAMPNASLASFCNWDPINYGIVEQSLGVTFGTGDDEAVCRCICDYLDENDPTFLFSQFDSVDGAGHGNGYGTEAHLAQITFVDGLLGKIYDKLSERGMLEDTLFMVISDHGGTPHGSHGGTTDAEKIVFFGATGKTVKCGTIGEMNVRDSAAIIMYALGLEVPEFEFGGFSGQVPTGLFEGYVPAERQDICTIPLSKAGALITPAVCEGKDITSYIPSEKITAHFPFDRSHDDAVGKSAVNVVGTPKYYGIPCGDGLISCIEIGRQGYLTLPDHSVGNDSFTVSVWVHVDGAVWNELPLLGTKKWSGNATSGFSLVYASYGFSFNIGNGKDEEKLPLEHSSPIDFGWNNITAVVDRAVGRITLYYNFDRNKTYDIPQSFDGASLDGGTFTIGQDTTGGANNTIDYKISELTLFSDALTKDEVASLRSFYKNSDR